LSFLIQNFYKPTNLVSRNYRFKLLTHYNNFYLLFSFYHSYLLYNRVFRHVIFTFLTEEDEFYDLFSSTYEFFESFFALGSRLHLTVKFHKTLWVNSLKLIDSTLNLHPFAYETIRPQNSLNSLAYFLPLRVVYFPLEKKIYKPLFTYLLLLFPFFWPAPERFYAYSNTFFYTPFIFKLIYFDNVKIFRTQHL